MKLYKQFPEKKVWNLSLGTIQLFVISEEPSHISLTAMKYSTLTRDSEAKTVHDNGRLIYAALSEWCIKLGCIKLGGEIGMKGKKKQARWNMMYTSSTII